MTMKVRDGVSAEDISLFCKRASRVTLSQVVDNVTVQEELRVEGDARRTQFTVNINFYPKVEYQQEYDLEPTELLAAFGTQFPLTLKKEIVSEMKKLDADLKSQMAQLGQGKKVRSTEGENEDDEDEAPKKKKDEDEESEVGDGDADDEKHARQKKQAASYSDDENDEDEEIGEYNDAALEAEFASDDDDAPSVEKAKKSNQSPFKALLSIVSEKFQRNLSHCVSFDYNSEKCMFKLEVRLKSHFLGTCPDPVDIFSSLLICLNCCLLALLSAHVVAPSSAKFRAFQTVSKSKETTLRRVNPRSR